jgi:uncharacterized membrane protein
MQNKVMWGLIIILSVAADLILPIWWGLIATMPIVVISWWIAYRSGWID